MVAFLAPPESLMLAVPLAREGVVSVTSSTPLICACQHPGVFCKQVGQLRMLKVEVSGTPSRCSTLPHGKLCARMSGNGKGEKEELVGMDRSHCLLSSFVARQQGQMCIPLNLAIIWWLAQGTLYLFPSLLGPFVSLCADVPPS